MASVQTASWQDVGYRSPRPGFFLGDDRGACPLRNASVLLDDAALPASCDLGRLGVLPLEMLHQVVADLADVDVRALVALRNVNRAAAAVVDSWRDFATVAAFPRAMAALVHLAPGPSGVPVSLSALAACLRTSECASCRRQAQKAQKAGQHADVVPYGDCIYLLTPERVCYSCFRSRPEYLPVTRVASGTSTPTPDHPELQGKTPTSIRVPPGRYGVLTLFAQSMELFDRRQVYGETMEAGEQETAPAAEAAEAVRTAQPAVPPRLLPHGTKTDSVRQVLSQPDPLRYAAVLPGPYWEENDDDEEEEEEPALSQGYCCLACAQTDRSAGWAGWADPLVKYTRRGLQQHLADPQFGGRVRRRRHPVTGADIYEHDAPRLARFPPGKEFGAMVNMARKYETWKGV